MKKHILAILILLAGPPALLYGGNGRWTVAGPEGAAIRAVAIAPSDPARMYASGESGFFRSMNGGGLWVRWGLTQTAIAVDPVDPNTVYGIRGTLGTKLYKSLDAGFTWQTIDPGGPELLCLAIDPQRAGTIYLGVRNGILRSQDGGRTWHMITIPSDVSVWSVAVDPFDSNRIYATAAPKGLHVTNDAGRSWTRVGAVPEHANSVAVDRSDSGFVVVGAQSQGWPEGGIYVSQDRGSTWVRRNPEFDVRSVIVAQGHTIYAATSAGVSRSVDAGASWTTPELMGGGADLAASGDTVLYGTSAGVFVSRGATAPFEQINSGLGFAVTTSIHLDPLDPRRVYASSHPGVFESGNGGKTWDRLDSAPADALAVDPEDRSVIYSAYGSALRKTADHGTTWKSIQLPKSGGPDFFPGIYQLAIDPANPRTVYAALSAGLGKSTDSGETWVLHTSGIPAGYYGGNPLFEIEISPADSATIFGESDNPLVKSVDGGVTWQVVDVAGVRQVYELAIDPIAPNFMYASVFISIGGTYGFARSADGGQTWSVTRREPTGAIAVVPGTLTLYAAVERGIQRSDDGGVTWNDFSEGLDPGYVRSLVVDRTGKHLYAATGNGVYSYTFGPDVPIDRLSSDPTRLSRLLDQLNALEPPPGTTLDSADGFRGLVLPVAASNAGANGTYFRSDVTLANYRPVGQDVLVAFLEAGKNGADAPSFRVTLPPFNSDESPITLTDFVGELGLSGSGAFVVIGIDESGNVDPAVRIGGYSRVWTRQQGSAEGTTSQALPLVGYENLLRSGRAVSLGLRLDNGFRTNLGVVNLESTPRTFQVEIGSEQRPARAMTIDVPPYSMRQVPVSESGFGSMTATFSIAGEAGLWTAYGVSVDNQTGDGWISQAAPAESLDATAAGSAVLVDVALSGVSPRQAMNVTWRGPGAGLDAALTNDVWVDPVNPRRVLAATDRGLFESSDAGIEWTKLHAGPTETVAASPNDPSIIYGVQGLTLNKTIDQGKSWRSIQLPRPAKQLVVDPANAQTVYAATTNGLGKSSDGGETWVIHNSGIINGWYGPEINEIDLDPGRSSTIFGGTHRGIVKSVDGGENWSILGASNFDGEVTAFAIDPSFPNVMYVYMWGYWESGMQGEGIFRSSDGGNHWIRMNDAPWGRGADITDIVVAPGTSTVYTATQYGIWRSFDGGSTWSDFRVGLNTPDVRSLAFDRTGKYLYAGTTRGVFTYVFGPDVPIDSLASDPARLVRLLEQVNSLPETTEAGGSTRALLLPVAASTAGAFGTHFRSDVTLANYRATAQDVLIAFLEAGKDGTDAPSFRMTLPPFNSAESPLTLTDMIAQLDLSGVGALVMIAIDANGDVDPAGALGGYSRIWTYQAGFFQATSSQAMPLIGHQDLLRAGPSAALGLRLDTEFRTNLGVVNLESRTRSFQVTLGNEKQSAKTVTIEVPPFSMVQVSAGQHDLGSTTATFTPVGEPGLWTAYGSSVDNHSGDGWVSEAAGIP